MKEGHPTTFFLETTIVRPPHNNMKETKKKEAAPGEDPKPEKIFPQKKRGSLPNGGYRMRPCYLLNKMESLFIATKFKGVVPRKLVLRWAELECKSGVNFWGEPPRPR